MNIRCDHVIVAGAATGPSHITRNTHNISLIYMVQCTKGSLNLIKHVGQTLSNIVGWCWTVFDQCWIVLDAGVFKRIQHHPTIFDFSTRHDIVAYIYGANEIVGRCWMKSLNKVKTLSNMFDVLLKWVEHVAFNNV